eukprot:3316975-Rhodomonas_salina.1
MVPSWASPNQVQHFLSKFSNSCPSSAIPVQVQQFRSKFSRKREFWCKKVVKRTKTVAFQ